MCPDTGAQRKRRWLGLAAYALLSGSARAEQTLAAKTIPRAEVRALSVTTDAGFIEVRGTSSGDVKVEAVRPDRTEGHCQLIVDVKDGRLSLEARRPDGQNGVCDAGFRVRAPRGASVQAYAGAGSVTVAAVRGETKVRTGSGRVRLDGIEAPVHVLTGGGSVEAHAEATPWLDVRTGAGDVTLSLGAARATVSARTGSGKIVVTLPRGAKARVKAQSPGGKVRDDVPPAAEAASSAAAIEAFSGSGDVTITTRRGASSKKL